jgi:hypothetical protein
MAMQLKEFMHFTARIEQLLGVASWSNRQKAEVIHILDDERFKEEFDFAAKEEVKCVNNKSTERISLDDPFVSDVRVRTTLTIFLRQVKTSGAKRDRPQVGDRFGHLTLAHRQA